MGFSWRSPGGVAIRAVEGQGFLLACTLLIVRHAPAWTADGGKTPAWNQGFKFPHIYPKVQKVLKVEVRTLIHMLMGHMATGPRCTSGSGTDTLLHTGTGPAGMV